MGGLYIQIQITPGYLLLKRFIDDKDLQVIGKSLQQAL
jgi:hypothetical protein